MGTDIHGWVEAVANPELVKPYWSAIADIDLLGGGFRDYPTLQALYGAAPSIELPLRPVAPERGVPDNASGTVHIAFNEWGGQDNVFGATWISGGEFLGAQWDRFAPFLTQWQPFRSIITALVALYGADHVRIVVWFNN